MHLMSDMKRGESDNSEDLQVEKDQKVKSDSGSQISSLKKRKSVAYQ